MVVVWGRDGASVLVVMACSGDQVAAGSGVCSGDQVAADNDAAGSSPPFCLVSGSLLYFLRSSIFS
ncbi:hypothetical protein HanIR_Chr02g0095041 [Helianthus annuus]|nr:hypothetical protein HanIR_Chr02g0095041 [Helianthus annuus]